MNEETVTLIEAVSDFYLDPFYSLLLAWFRAEGGERDPKYFINAIKSTPPPKNLGEALAKAAKTIRGRATSYCEFCEPGGQPLFTVEQYQGDDPWTGEDHPRRLRVSDQFIEFLGARIAPINADNDPHGLNRNWVPNVKSAYAALLKEETWRSSIPHFSNPL